MRRIAQAIVTACVLVSPLRADGPFADLTFDAACKQADEEHKLVFIDFYTTWCGPCRMMERSTFRDESVIKLLKEKFVALKLDAEKEVALARRFGVHAYPTLLFLKPDGSLVDRIIGFRNAQAFQADVNAILKGKDSLARARDALDAAGKDDPMARLQFARQLVAQGKDAEALENLLWCFDHGLEHGRGFYGVRLSYLLSDIDSLGRRYPPAKQALIERRDDAEAKLLANEGTGQLFHDFLALNRTLHDNARTLRVYDGMSGAQKDKLAAGLIMQDLLREARRYREILQADGAAARLIAIVKFDLAQAKLPVAAPANGKDERMQKMLTQTRHRYAISSAADAIEILAGAGKTEQAKQLVDETMELDASDTTRAQLLQRARRAENADVVAYIQHWTTKTPASAPASN